MDATLQARFDRQLDVWREKLLSLDRRQRLLYFRHTRTASLELERPSPWILEALSARGFRLEPGLDEDGEAREIAPQSSPPAALAKGKTAAALHASVRSLERTTQTAFVDRGLWVLYLGLGFVTWTDMDDVEAHSPLLLVPVRLVDVGTSGHPRVERGDEDPQINPLLVAKFKRDFGIDLEDLEPDEAMSSLLGTVRTRLGRRASWAVTDRVVLSTFTFHKEAMYRDLQENSDTLREHPLVQLIALGPVAPSLDDVAFDPVDEARLDEVAPPEELHTILDADASQRRCIVAARDGRSFVMDGPPGTGKSQTIANMIAELMANERSVLFVSEKAAALDVVRKRLDDVGLSPFLLELHSHKATRKAVAQEFGRALDERPHATVAFGEAEFRRLEQERWRLSNYAQAMNEQRRPLEATLHSVLGEIGQRSHVQTRRLADLNAWSKLRPEDRATLDDLAVRLSRSWGPVERFGDFLWHGIDLDEASPARIDDLRRLAEDVAESASKLIDLGNAVAEDLRLDAPGTLDAARRLSRLLHLSKLRPISGVPDDDERERSTTVAWLTRDDLASIEASIRRAGSARDDLDAAEHSLMTAMRGGAAATLDVLKRLTKGAQVSIAPLPRWSADAEAQIGDAESLLGTLSDLHQKAAEALGLAQRLAPPMGLNPESLGLRRASDLAGLAAILASADRPAPGWFNPVIQPQLDLALATLEPLIAKVTQDQESLSATFKPEALAAPLAELQAVVSSHRGPRRFSKVSRAARRQLAEVSMTGRCDKALLRKLPDAVSWQETTRSLEAAEAEHAAPLKDYYRGQDTDFRRVAAALETARKAISLARDDLDPAALDRALSNHGTSDHTIVHMGQQLSEISTWWATTGPRVLGQDFADLLAEQPLAAVRQWAATASESVRDGIQAWQETETTAQTSFNAATVRVIAQLAQSLEDARERLRVVLGRDAQLLGAFADPRQPVLSRASEALTWVREVRNTRGGSSFDPETAWAVLDPAITGEEIGARVADYEAGIAAVGSRFAAPRSGELAQDLEDLNEGRWLLLRMADTASSDIPEHVEYVKVATRLREAGLGAVVDDLVTRCPPAHEVPDAIIRSVLEAWVEGVIADDDRLKPLRAADRDDIVARFRELDRDMVRTTAARVINISARRRPRSIGGPAAHLRREAEKRSRHLPIRESMMRAGSVAKAVKPCFMMSPLAVSQYLPPDFTFDVVIFDEASQVLPEDAVNCVYRGRQLIVAGDQKQLPPTNFFHEVESGDGHWEDDEPDDFQSVLDLAKASGMPSLPLTWHYRSRHEALIAYSNYRFYEGRLQTFPGPVDTSESLGVVSIQVAGTYRRGAQRDNPEEADKVVERVLHHLRHSPGRSVGVVAFSAAQEDAVVAAMERQSAQHPQLLTLLGSTDRLEGFFVKNLENVQGDERDIIIFTVGYGLDEAGKFTLNLGPLTRDGGWRRLNVAITRARYRNEIVHSILPQHFGTNAREGVLHLQRYLDYAIHGPKSLAIDLTDSMGDVESPFEADVLRTIRSWGYDAVPQVGTAGYRLDIGILDPDNPGQYLLAVECDGAAYHSSKVARDRDRLREQVLTGLGWKLHRIWGLSWYRDREAQQLRLKSAIETARVDSGASGTTSTREHQDNKTQLVTIETVAVDHKQRPEWTTPYRSPGPVLVPVWVRGPKQFLEPSVRPHLDEYVTAVARTNSPIHVDALKERVRTDWGIARVGANIQKALEQSIRRVARRHDDLEFDGSFIRATGSPAAGVRVPITSEDVRPVQQIPPEELERAVWGLVRDAHALPREDLLHGLRDLFGWRRLGADIEAALNRAITRLEKQGKVSKDAMGHLVAEGDVAEPGV